MPYVSVHVDASDVLEELDDADLEQELARRRKRSGKAESRVEPWTAQGIADDLRTAFYARNASRFEALLRVLEPGTGALIPGRDPVARFSQADH